MLTVVFQIALVLVAAALGGCAAVQGPQAEIAGQSVTQPKLEIVYRAERPQPRHSASGVSQDQRAWTLFVSAPHAKCKPGYARVELIEHSAAATPEQATASSTAGQWVDAMEGILPGIRLGEGIAAARTLDVREVEVRSILAELDTSGFFLEPAREFDEQVVLVVRRDSSATARRWQSMASLNRLRTRVRKEGRLVGYTGPAVSETDLLPEPTAAPSMVRLPVVGP